MPLLLLLLLLSDLPACPSRQHAARSLAVRPVGPFFSCAPSTQRRSEEERDEEERVRLEAAAGGVAL
ncbi:unnamed protein product [Lampetra fluviatilis]